MYSTSYFVRIFPLKGVATVKNTNEICSKIRFLGPVRALGPVNGQYSTWKFWAVRPPRLLSSAKGQNVRESNPFSDVNSFYHGLHNSNWISWKASFSADLTACLCLSRFWSCNILHGDLIPNWSRINLAIIFFCDYRDVDNPSFCDQVQKIFPKSYVLYVHA